MSLAPRWTVLSAALAEEAERYAQALRAAEELPAALRDGRDFEPYLQELVQQLDEITRIEQRIAGAKQQWLQAGDPSPPELEALRARLVELIRAVQARVSWAEQEATLRKHQLMPQLDALIRGRQMQRAYDRSLPYNRCPE